MIEIRKTGDGSHTLFVPELNEHYHSAFGAMQESMHVFITEGLNFLDDKKDLSILEAGFGTGLNAWLSALQAGDRIIKYHGVEAYPLEKKVTGQLNYPELMADAEKQSLFHQLHEAAWNHEIQITENFILTKTQAKLQDAELPEANYDLVYFDAFAPDVQPELWTQEIFEKIYSAMKPGGILVTYSSKGLVKQNLRAAGFTVKRLPGPPGKKHMVRAEKAL